MIRKPAMNIIHFQVPWGRNETKAGKNLNGKKKQYC